MYDSKESWSCASKFVKKVDLANASAFSLLVCANRIFSPTNSGFVLANNLLQAFNTPVDLPLPAIPSINNILSKLGKKSLLLKNILLESSYSILAPYSFLIRSLSDYEAFSQKLFNELRIALPKCLNISPLTTEAVNANTPNSCVGIGAIGRSPSDSVPIMCL
jgi:hypothetical protein